MRSKELRGNQIVHDRTRKLRLTGSDAGRAAPVSRCPPQFPSGHHSGPITTVPHGAAKEFFEPILLLTRVIFPIQGNYGQ
jgi:hypothetical protein